MSLLENKLSSTEVKKLQVNSSKSYKDNFANYKDNFVFFQFFCFKFQRTAWKYIFIWLDF